jgi:hypothetical protein
MKFRAHVHYTEHSTGTALIDAPNLSEARVIAGAMTSDDERITLGHIASELTVEDVEVCK